ncbi:DUF1616 domain-containing protein [Halalkalicoccus jeotgali]|uniref:DUF1616 domain-containing protein n=1 Tax=Halalkalicoccus jeotgali (strain DSM 18796 / CECT 7217 / JCM 14584 / KCTC 4019 / B3) TaxID=795797 RepID=D8J7I3_HALJB|nr:DUF1616 domain-containing protein [Halalkalicoccus jeotgali]ADJ14078.1 hypothetical protein HacjB3_03435 [Halalkalicoccus jeotgali B3]ELY33878.1 hypothetical protein C497_15872 [Halalkalicoccus jeotgali B3]
MQDTVEGRAGRSSLRRAPADLIAVGSCVLIVSLMALPAFENTPVRTVARALFVGFVPGYALLTALFPRSPTGPKTEGSRFRIGHLERAALSIAASCGLLVLIARGAPAGIGGSSTTLGILVVLSVAFGGIGAIRRLSLTPAERFGRPAVAWIDAVGSLGPSRSDGSPVAAVAVGVAVLVVLSTLGVAYAMGPVQGDGYTELYLLQEGANGTVSEEYPDELTVGQEEPLVVGIGNEEGVTTTYTVVIQLQEVGTEGEQSVQSASELDRFEVTLESGETVENEHVVTPDRAGENLRLTYLLYTGTPPETIDGSEAYRSAYVWVNVTESGG